MDRYFSRPGYGQMIGKIKNRKVIELRKASEGGALAQRYGASDMNPKSQPPNRNRNVQFSQTNRFADDEVDLSWVHRFMRPVPEAVLKTWKMIIAELIAIAPLIYAGIKWILNN